MKSCIDFSNPHDPAAPRLRQQFGRPLRVLAAYACDEVPAVLQAVEQAAQQGVAERVDQWIERAVAHRLAPAAASGDADSPIANRG